MKEAPEPRRKMKTPRQKPSSSLCDRPDIQERIKELKAHRDRILIRLVTSISRACIMYGTRSLSHLGITISQATVLGELFGQEECRQEDLRGAVALDKGNVTRALQGLEELGLVQRRQDPADRRVVRVNLTKKALTIEEEMFAFAVLWDERLTAGFTPEERETVVGFLQRMEANARAMNASNDPPPDGSRE